MAKKIKKFNMCFTCDNGNLKLESAKNIPTLLEIEDFARNAEDIGLGELKKLEIIFNV